MSQSEEQPAVKINLHTVAFLIHTVYIVYIKSTNYLQKSMKWSLVTAACTNCIAHSLLLCEWGC